MLARDHPPRALARLVLAALLVLTVGSAPALAADQTLALEVTINGAPTQKIGEFTLRDGVLLARPEELGALGLRIAPEAVRTAEGLVVVSTLPGVGFDLDQAAQAVRFRSRTAALVPHVLGAGPPPDTGPPLESGTGATLNYEVSQTLADGGGLASGLFDLRLFSPWGVASTGLLAFSGDNPVGRVQSPTVRLDTTYVYSDFANQRRYWLGDVVTGGLSWTRPVRLGGGQVSQDFSMRPDLVTFPLPLVEGAAAVPSTVDVLVNGAKVLSSQAPPGPFQVPQLPVLSGAGTISMTVTDAVGRQVTTTLPFYASPTLLAPDLTTFSVEAGAVRRDWGLVSNDYGRWAGSATYRRGLSPNLTVEAHAEGASGLVMAGAGVVADLNQFAVVNVALAGSGGDGRQGARLAIGIDRLARRFSFGGSAVFASSGFRDIAALNGDPAPRRQIAANAGLSLGRWGWAGLAYAETRRDLAIEAGVAASSPPFGRTQRSQVLTASYSVQTRHAFLYASAFHDFVRDGGDGVVIGLTLPLGPRSSATASLDTGSTSHAQFSAQQSANDIGDWGYQVLLATGDDQHEFAQGEYKARWAQLSAGLDHGSGATTGRVDVRGALSFLDGRLFASNLINDSFAVVDTGDAAGVRVLYENRDAGRTDTAGRRLVPDLRSFDLNNISIDTADLPVDAIAPYASRTVRPPDRSGVVVAFPVRVQPSALLILRDEQGLPLPVGSMATLGSSGAAAPVGYDGQAFVSDLTAQNDLEVQAPDGSRCAVAFPFVPVKGDIPRVGPLICRRAAP